MAEMKHYTLGEYVKLLEEKGMLAEYDLQGKDGEEISKYRHCISDTFHQNIRYFFF